MKVVVYKSDDQTVLFIDKWEDRQFDAATPIDIPFHLLMQFRAAKVAAEKAEKEIMNYCEDNSYEV